MAAARKRSKQRDSIWGFLQTRTDHPTAETVYQNIRQEIPNISLATVYRNLSLLAEMGQIQKFSPDKGPDRFDPIAAPHDHFICTACGSVMDLESASGSEAGKVSLAGEPFPGRIDRCLTYYYGLCPDCLRAEEAF